MVDLDQLDCKIYVEASQSLDELANTLSAALGGESSISPYAAVIYLPSAEVEIRKNEDAERQRIAEFPEGFLHFQYTIDVFRDPAVGREERVLLGKRILKFCWQQSWPAVAACDYETELPNQGGYNNRAVPWPSPDSSLFSLLRFDGFPVSWAGPHPWKDGFAFGSSDGRLLFTDWDGTPLQHKPHEIPPPGGAINGVASIPPWMAISTRMHVLVVTSPQQRGDKSGLVRIPLGANGVIASTRGYFFAPLGHKGLLFTRPTNDPEQCVKISTATTERIVFHRVISRQENGGREIVACALRSSGVGVMEFEGEDRQHDLKTLTYDGLDVVDICPLNSEKYPLAAAAVGRDGTMILFRDVLHEHRPCTLKYTTLNGEAIRLLSSRGYLILLMKKSLYGFAGLIDRFLSGVTRISVTPVLEVPIEVVDANLAANRWVLIVTPNGVLRLDMNQLIPHSDSKRSESIRGLVTPDFRIDLQSHHPIAMHPNWHRREIKQELQLAER